MNVFSDSQFALLDTVNGPASSTAAHMLDAAGDVAIEALKHARETLPLTPERSLMLAVLEQAWLDALRPVMRAIPAKSKTTVNRLQDAMRNRRVMELERRDAIEWIEGAAPDVGWPFSFEAICFAFHIDAEAMREQLRRVLAAEAFKRHGKVQRRGVAAHPTPPTKRERRRAERRLFARAAE